MIDDAPMLSARRRAMFRAWQCAATLILLGALALTVDVPIASWVREGRCPGVINKLCGLSETFSHAVGVALIVSVIAVLDPRRRAAIPRIIAAALGSGLVANAFKLMLARVRPHHFDFDAADSSLDAFGSWFPLWTRPSWEQGFPSSHAATAAGLAIVLTRYYPRGRWLFPVLAALAGLQRVVDKSHFLSDVLWGAAVGCLFAPLCVYGGRLARRFDRFEARHEASSQSEPVSESTGGLRNRAA